MWGVSVTIGLLALIGAGLIATVGGMKWPRVAAALTLTGTAGLIGGTFGPALHRMVTHADTTAGQLVGRLTGAAVFGLVGVIVTGIWALRVYAKKIDMKTLGLSAGVPLVINLIPGMLGTAAIAVVGLIPWLVSGILSFLFFGHWS